MQLPQSGSLTSNRSNEVDADVYPDAPAIVNVSTPGPATPTASVTIAGAATAGYTVNLYDGGHYLGSVVAAAGTGAWSFTIWLGVGTHVLGVTQTSVTVPGGKYTSDLATQSVTVYAPPSAPTISSTINGAASAGAVVSGRGVVNGYVELYENGFVVGTANVDTNGTWVSTLSLLPVGKHTITARIKDTRSNFWSGYTTFTVIVVPDAPVVQPLPQQPAPGSWTLTVTVAAVAGYTVTLYDNGAKLASNTTGVFTVTLAVGSHSLTATQTATVGGLTYTSAASTAVSLTVYAAPSAPTVSSTTTGTATTAALVSGRGVANGAVELYESGALVGTATADTNGNWTSVLNVLPAGKHTLTARIQDPRSGFWSALGSSFTVTVVPDAPLLLPVGTQGAPGSWTVTVTVVAVPGYSVSLYDNGAKLASNTTGVFTVTLAVGSHSLTATQTATVGGLTFTSAASTALPVTVYAAPSAPTISSSSTGTTTVSAVVQAAVSPPAPSRSPRAARRSARQRLTRAATGRRR